MDILFEKQPICNNIMCLHYQKKSECTWNKTHCDMFEIDPISDENKTGFAVLDCLARNIFNKIGIDKSLSLRNTPLSNHKRLTLKTGQKELYILFYNSIIEKRIVNKLEIFLIYRKNVAKGHGYIKFWNQETQNYIYKLHPWSESKWNTNFNMWFINTLGCLLKKGYLKFVPAIDLSKFDIDQIVEYKK